MSRHHCRGRSGKVEMAAPVPAEKVLKHLGWNYVVVYDFGSYKAIHDVYRVGANAEDAARRLNAERGEGCRCYQVAPIRGVSEQ